MRRNTAEIMVELTQRLIQSACILANLITKSQEDLDYGFITWSTNKYDI